MCVSRPPSYSSQFCCSAQEPSQCQVLQGRYHLRQSLLLPLLCSHHVIPHFQGQAFATDHGARINQYNADNSRFADNAFKQYCSQQRQTFTYCGVNMHFQNDIAERAIRDITEAARTMLLHAKARWPSVVQLSLWPYGVRMAVHVHDTVPVLLGGRSQLELFLAPMWDLG
eukprot:CCRYP_003825-RA/>CCRYP_003825-RA protein AED:0.61 eAED:0.47 QI:0/-1/0/1/-1/0/1/0/169